MTVSVIVPTYNRPDCVRHCVERLCIQEPPPDQIIIVDASVDFKTCEAVAEFPNVVYLRNANGRGNTPSSRNMAIKHCTSDIIAFLDDDAFAHPGWNANLIATYADAAIGGVAGRALNNQPGEATTGVDDIGKLKPDGRLTGNFAADPGKIIEVDHMIGCNMSLRREVVMKLGGFKDDYPAGPFGICEETEICIRARRMGYRFVFNPAVAVDHIGAPQPGGRRFSPKYTYYHTRNNVVMLIRNYGLQPIVWRHIAAIVKHAVPGFIRQLGSAVAHLSAYMIGLCVGFTAGLILAVRRGTNPVRHDAEGQEITAKLKSEYQPSGTFSIETTPAIKIRS